MGNMKVLALDADDLGVVAAHTQDAIVRAGDLAYLPRERRVAFVLNRFDWSSATPGATTFRRCTAGLRFENVTRAQFHGFDPKLADRVLVLLTIAWSPDAEAPGGWVTLHFAAGAAIRLQVESIEAELKDLGAAWATRSKPDHSAGDDAVSHEPAPRVGTGTGSAAD